MRPRRIRRGERNKLELRKVEAETLQCGHGEFAVENILDQLRGLLAADTSFNAATANSPWRTIPAHILGGDGKLLQCGHGEFAVENFVRPCLERPAQQVLQCGHGEFAVENSGRPPAPVLSACTLQCGHGEFAVENNTVL